jgi:hypothetical protein
MSMQHSAAAVRMAWDDRPSGDALRRKLQGLQNYSLTLLRFLLYLEGL